MNDLDYQLDLLMEEFNLFETMTPPPTNNTPPQTNN